MSMLVRLLPLAALASVGASPISSDHLSGRLVHPHINRNNHARSIESRGDTSYVPPNVNLSSVQPNSAINSAAYHNLSNQLPVILSNAVSTSNHSWELGTLVETLLEVYNPGLTPFGWNPNVANCDTSQVPWAALQIILASLYETNWTGAPSSGSPGANSSSSLQGLANYLNSSTSPTALTGATLIDGDGALGDPCSLGSGVWVLAQFCTRDDVRNALGAKSGESYAWAVGNQLQHMESGTRNDNGEYEADCMGTGTPDFTLGVSHARDTAPWEFGLSTDTVCAGTISQREGYFELWSDMGFMITPFPACECGKHAEQYPRVGARRSHQISDHSLPSGSHSHIVPGPAASRPRSLTPQTSACPLATRPYSTFRSRSGCSNPPRCSIRR